MLAVHLWLLHLQTPLDPLHGDGYQFWSGVASSLGIVGLLWKHWNCHERGCLRHGKYVIEGGVRCCDTHHPALDVRPENGRGRVQRLHALHLEHVHGPTRAAFADLAKRHEQLAGVLLHGAQAEPENEPHSGG